jgi:hypothetical protein
MSDPAVTNSTCLIGLERIQRLDILPQVFSPITIPPAVLAEVGITATWLTSECSSGCNPARSKGYWHCWDVSPSQTTRHHFRSKTAARRP